MSIIQSLVRSTVRSMPGYVSARHLAKSGKIFLDANENAFGSVLPKIEGVDLSRYPDPFADKLRMELAKYVGTAAKNILLGNGSDEIIWLLLFAFVGKGDEVLIPAPTFSMYEIFSGLTEGKVCKVDLEEDYILNADKVLRAVNQKTKIIFLCSPNNPTGQVVPLAEIEKIVKKSKKLVVVDEAYIEFAPEKTAVNLVKKYPNLLILRTFSKAWGLAGLRVGYAIADTEVIEVLAKVRAPYSVDLLSATLAERALKAQKNMEANVRKLLAEKEKLMEELWKLNLVVYPSDANFLLVKFPKDIESAVVYKKLVETAGIVLRDFGSKKNLKNCIRITVGNERENAKLLGALRRLRRAGLLGA